MTRTDSTCWTLVKGAASGDAALREDFAQRYEPVIRAYLGARWRDPGLVSDLDDTVQEVFVEFFKPRGILERCDPESPGGFRALLYGVVRNVARRAEQNRKDTGEREKAVPEDDAVSSREESLSAVFDRAWAHAVLRDARQRQRERARIWGVAAEQRVELLVLRFEQGLGISEIAQRWNADAAHLHHEYAKARTEFREALREAVAFYHPNRHDDVEDECSRLLQLLAPRHDARNR